MNNQFSHTFVICAYKESPYLEECIRSLKSQSVFANILMTTSTPNSYISDMADKYGIRLLVRDGKSDIRDDWNFGYNKAGTEWVTIAHQDDVYDRDYLKNLIQKASRIPDAVMYLTDYIPIRNGSIGKRDLNSRIRRILRIPLKSKWLAGKRFWKRAVLSLGNSICCPSVTYHKSVLGENVFTSDLKFNIDWDTFLKLADMPGTFVYSDETLTYYRVHQGATSAEFINNHKREADDITMFRKFWPGWVVRIIMVFYKVAYKTYS